MIIGSKILHFERLPSTNTFLADKIRTESLPEGSIISTGYQTSGRGQMGNRWESEAGKNLLISILLFPDMIDPALQFSLSMVVSLGVIDFLSRNVNECAIKWPNDLYVKNDKIAGILIENSITGGRIDRTIAGIGLNVNQEVFPDNLPNPVSLKQLTGSTFDLGTCLSQVASHADKRYKQLIAGDLTGIRKDYIARMYRLNEWSDYRDNSGRFTGCIRGISEEGRILIEDRSGAVREYLFKEVEFIL